LYDHTSVWSNDEQRHIHAGEELRNKRKELLDKRWILIEELMHAGSSSSSSSSRYAGEYTNQNVRCYDIATKQSLDLLLLRRSEHDAELVLNIHLLTGKFEEVYNLSCHYMRKDREVLRGDGLNMIWQKEVRHKNITKSFIQQKVREENTRFVKLDSIHWDAMVNIFLVKYMLHMSMEALHLINKNFLDNKDCINLIGEYMGLKKEWIITDNSNWYRNQAHEVAHLIHCADFYRNNVMESEDGPDWDESFDSVSRVAEQYFPGKTSVIDIAVKVGKEWITNFKLKQNFLENKDGMSLISGFVGKDSLIMDIRWKELIKSYEADRMLICTLVIKSLLYHAAKRINILAGWEAMGTNVNPFQCITEFVTETMSLCENTGCTFQDIFPHDQWGEDGRHDEMDYDESSLVWEWDSELQYAIVVSIAIEQKLAQYHFHLNKGSDSIKEILDQLPGRGEAYASYLPPVDSDYLIREVVLSGYISNVQDKYYGRNVDEWPEDLNELVTALFKSGLATKDNLDLLFGRSGYVSYQIWKLQKQKNERMQPSISSYIIRSRIWKEGCTDNDTSQGLKIKYLNKDDRAQKFDELRNVISVGGLLKYLQPSLNQFITRFGFSCLDGNKFLEEFCFISDYDYDTSKIRGTGSMSKRQRCDLDSFLNVEDACRHYFDTRSLEEAVWDHVGVPRIIILNGNRERMQKAGWKYSKDRSILGDNAVTLGNRIAHVYSPSCSVWMED